MVSDSRSITKVPFAAVFPPTPEMVTLSPVRGDLPDILLTVQTMGDAFVHPLIVRLPIVTVPPA